MSQIVEEATIEDGQRILEIIESSPAKGRMQIIYTRRPNAYDSYQKESQDVDVFVMKEDNHVFATVVNIVRDVYIDGTIKRLSYISGLKRDPAFKREY